MSPCPPKLKLLVAANGPKDVSWAQAIAVRLSKDQDISIKVLIDDLTHRLTQEFPAYVNRSLVRHVTDTVQEIETAKKEAYELAEWADLLVIVPLDSDHLAKMLRGIADTMLLEVLRSWKESKLILLAPGMSNLAWSNPLTKRQLEKVGNKWPWVRVLSPILWHYEPAPGSSNHDKRVVEWHGFREIIKLIMNQSGMRAIGHDHVITTQSPPLPDETRVNTRLPPELWSIIFDFVDDWELGQALDVNTSLTMPVGKFGWRSRDLPSLLNPVELSMRDLEWTILSADETAICKKIRATTDKICDLSPLALKLLVRFSLVRVLKLLEKEYPVSLEIIESAIIPAKASLYGRIDVLDWWATSYCFRGQKCSAEALDGASQNGHVHVLEWWKQSGFRLCYTEAAMKDASQNGHVAVLEWWRTTSIEQNFQLKLGGAILVAIAKNNIAVVRWFGETGIADQDSETKYELVHSAVEEGRVDLLEMWRQLRGDDNLFFKDDVLCDVTVHGKLAMLDWWRAYATGTLPGMNRRKGKKVTYDPLAILDYVATPETREWWARLGVEATSESFPMAFTSRRDLGETDLCII